MPKVVIEDYKPRARRFGGKIYHPWSTPRTKTNAQSTCHVLRKEGKLVRTVKGKRGYQVYYR